LSSLDPTCRACGHRHDDDALGSFEDSGSGQPRGFDLARFRLDRCINLLKVLGFPYHFQGMGILSQDFIEPIRDGSGCTRQTR
jgi:hypothetical protein